jgi:hypothetical protein
MGREAGPMHRISMLFLILGLATSLAQGADRKFPYEAVVSVEEEYVRSGAGRNYYPTSKLHRGDRVTVHRHDPGGWAMISPPAGSFNWVRADHVRQKSNYQGVVVENGVIARIGSEFNDDNDFYLRELSKGDLVEILGEKTFETDRGPVKMLKIKPPRNEFRWIMGKALVPTDAPVRKPAKQGDVAARPVDNQMPLISDSESDPFDDGPIPHPDGPTLPPTRQNDESTTTAATRPSGPQDDVLDQMRSRLAAIDDQFRAMIKEEPSSWDLVGMEQQYRQLEELTDAPAFKTQIKLRLQAVEKYAKLKTEYDEFVRITTEAKQRDAQLLSLTNSPTSAPTPTSAPASPLGPAPESPSTVGGGLPPAKPAPAGFPKKFDGAGIIQRSASGIRGAPPYVLVAPGGKILAYLQPAPGIDLSPYVGQSMGVIGQRSFRQELQAEMIVVRSLQPVRLKGGS